MKHTLRFIAWLSVLVLLCGCTSVGDGENTLPTGSTLSVQIDPTMQVIFPGISGGEWSDGGMVSYTMTTCDQIRLEGYNAGWVDRFVGEYGSYRLINDVSGLNSILDAISQMGKNINRDKFADYNDDFFAKYRVMLIPRQSGSGSVIYDAVASNNGDLITVSLIGNMPEVGTADMADWLVLVALDRETFPEGIQIDLLASSVSVTVVEGEKS